ncbi:DUF4907 domain-containing protein [Spirosoma sp.]|uniref:DUF4907 domain-containing protein n=1 Tax=Spirosoma sp. TaxID=1899569 RepID=UPI0026287AA0|nr:DUF4907 domain-containing protein [Spirosoma sp.]MCX6216183.1 DUF4907 domain-containing protein [Spirosoma sp.]
MKTNLVRKGLLLVLLVLAVLTVRLVYQRMHPYTVDVFQTAGGWGYSIVTNGELLIHQPTIPGQPGIVGFASKDEAKRVGERVAEKIQKDKAMPTLTNDELRRLGVKIP